MDENSDIFNANQEAARALLGRHDTIARGTGLNRVSDHARRSVAHAVCGDKEPCINELASMLDSLRPVVENEASFARDPLVRTNLPTEYTFEIQALLVFCANVAFLRSDEQLLTNLQSVWLEPSTPSDFTDPSLVPRDLFRTMLAIRRGDLVSANTHLAAAMERVEDDVGIEDYDAPIPAWCSERALVGVLSADATLTSTVASSIWEAKLRLIYSDPVHLFSLYHGSILGEKIGVIGLLAKDSHLKIDLPRGPRYWW